MRTAGMRASSTLFTSWHTLHWRPILWSAWHTRVVALAVGVGGLITAAVFTAGASRSDVNYCTPETPYAPYSSVCTGYGTSCGLSPTCTPVPNIPGTMGPNGYTPMCSFASCRP